MNYLDEAQDTMRPIVTAAGGGGTSAAPAAAPAGPTLQQEVGFLNGLNPNGTINATSYWGMSGTTARKWGSPTAGTGATITYSFDSASHFSAREEATILKAFAMWESVANVHFVEAPSRAGANLLMTRGHDGGAYTSVNATQGSGSTLGTPTGQALISIDTSVTGFDLSGSFKTIGGYGQATIIHEVGHLLGLGHGGAYNGNVDPATQQFSAYDERMWSTMSYIFWAETNAKYHNQYPVQGTDWGVTQDGYDRQAPHTVMDLDILAIQQLYGAPTDTPLAGGTTYGFHTNIEGPLRDFFNFRTNTDPVVTLFNTGTGNKLDVSGYTADQRIDLHPGSFSDVGGHVNNVGVAFGTRIESATGGSGNDTITASDVASTLRGGDGRDTLKGGAGDDALGGDAGNDRLVGAAGNDTLKGGDGNDTLIGGIGKDVLTGNADADTFTFADGDFGGTTPSTADKITDFSSGDHDIVDLSAVDANTLAAGDQAFDLVGTSAFDGMAGELRYQIGGSYTMIYGDTDGDKVADIAIRLTGSHVLTTADFVL